MRIHLGFTSLLTTLVLAAGCDGEGSSSHQDPVVFPTDECVCLALGADYANNAGSATAIGIPSLAQANVAHGGISGDPVVRYESGKFYIVNRVVANLTVVDTASFAVEAQFSVGEPTANPQDVAVLGDQAWIVYLAEPSVKVFDLSDTAAAPTTIALPKIAADLDGNPDAASIAIVGGKAYVTVQHLEMFAPAASGQVVVIDTATRTVTTTLDLPEQNPTNFLRAHGDTLFVGVTPDYTPATGCLAKIATGGAPSADCMATSASLGGYVTGVAPAADGSLFVAVAKSFSEGQVVRVGADGVVDTQPYTGAGQQPTDVAVCGKYLVANDAATGGVRVYDTSTRSEATRKPIKLGQPAAFASGIACFAQ